MPFSICISHKSRLRFIADFQFALDLQRLQASTPISDYEVTRIVTETSVSIFAHVQNTPTAELQLMPKHTTAASLSFAWPRDTKHEAGETTARQFDIVTGRQRTTKTGTITKAMAEALALLNTKLGYTE